MAHDVEKFVTESQLKVTEEHNRNLRRVLSRNQKHSLSSNLVQVPPARSDGRSSQRVKFQLEPQIFI